MATYSSNVTQKIGGGGSFNLAASGDILTTGTNEFAKVILRGKGTIVSSSTFALLINSVLIAGGVFPNAGDFSLNEDAIYNASGFAGASSFEVIVPPNSTLSLSAASVSNIVVKGSFQKFLNTP